MKFIAGIAVALIFDSLRAQQIPTTTILENIRRLQVHGDSFYGDGLFPSERFRRTGVPRRDNTIFFTALTAYTLQSVRPFVTPSEQETIDTVTANAQRNYFRYASRHGEPTYNFWQTHPDLPLPDDPRAGKQKFRMPDDFDDTAIIYLTLNPSDSICRRLKDEMGRHANRYRKKVHGTFRRYRRYPAYNTWFEKDMRLDFDLCVQTNTLLLLLNSGLPLTWADSATISLIREVVRRGDEIRHPRIIAPYYPNRAIILYHLARLLSSRGARMLNDIRPTVVDELQKEQRRHISDMERVLLNASLCRLNVRPTGAAGLATPGDVKTFVFFEATPFAGRSLWIRRLVGNSGWMTYHHRCEAYNWTLVLEGMVLRNEVEKARR